MSTTDLVEAVENPVTGEHLSFRERTPERLAFDYVLEPDGFALGRLAHVHPRQVEQFEVRSGRLGVRVAGREWTATPGSTFSIPAGTAHTVWNDGLEPVHAVVELRPGLEMAAFFESAYGLASEGKTNRWGLPGPLRLAVLLDAYPDHLYLARLPRSLQFAAAALLAPIARSLGYRANEGRGSASDGRGSSGEGRGSAGGRSAQSGRVRRR